MRFFKIYKFGFYAALACTALGCQSTAINPSNHSSVAKRHSVVSIIAGTYNTKGSEGIYRFDFDPQAQSFSEPKLLAASDNPSFLKVQGDSVFSVNELGKGALSHYKKSDSGLLLQKQVETLGASPCYISLSPSQRFLATANYMGGSVSIFRLDAQGAPISGPQVLVNRGKGPNKSRQEAPHAHWVQWSDDEQKLYSVDLGIDTVKVHAFDMTTGQAAEGRVALKLSPGDGPRHLYFHPNKDLAYILNELSNTISVARVKKDGTFKLIQKVDMLPESFQGDNHGGHIYVNTTGTRLYASNRGHNSIAVFSINASGQLTMVDIESTGGGWPRHFLVMEELGLMFVGNQEGHNVTVLKIEGDGTLSSVLAELALPQVTFLGRY